MVLDSPGCCLKEHIPGQPGNPEVTLDSSVRTSLGYLDGYFRWVLLFIVARKNKCC